MPQKFETWFHVSFDLVEGDTTRGLVSYGRESLSVALQEADDNRRYYADVAEYEGPFEVTIFERCKHCHGAGEVPSKRRGRIYQALVPCKVCKGKDCNVLVAQYRVQNPLPRHYTHPEEYAHVHGS